jgi:hypothetical protein
MQRIAPSRCQVNDPVPATGREEMGVDRVEPALGPELEERSLVKFIELLAVDHAEPVDADGATLGEVDRGLVILEQPGILDRLREGGCRLQRLAIGRTECQRLVQALARLVAVEQGDAIRLVDRLGIGLEPEEKLPGFRVLDEDEGICAGIGRNV